jgi:hypothetical protein
MFQAREIGAGVYIRVLANAGPEFLFFPFSGGIDLNCRICVIL